MNPSASTSKSRNTFKKKNSVAALHWFVTFYHLKPPEAHIPVSMCHLTRFTTKPVVHTSFRGQDSDYVNAMVPTMRLPHNYSRNGCGEKSWRVERSLWWSSGLRAPYKGSALHMTLYSMTFYHSRTVSFVRCIFEYQLKAFPGSSEEIDLVMERWEWHRIAIYTLRSKISPSCTLS